MNCRSCEDWPCVIINGSLYCQLCAERYFGPDCRQLAERPEVNVALALLCQQEAGGPEAFFSAGHKPGKRGKSDPQKAALRRRRHVLTGGSAGERNIE